MSKADHVRQLLESAGEDGPKGPYRAYFYFFNRQQFYEAHDILESLWLADPKGSRSNFYKALIQLAGAFVHLQKRRVQPAIALFKLSRSYLEKYPPVHEGLDLQRVLEIIDGWLARLETIQPSPEIRFELRGVSLKLEPCD